MSELFFLKEGFYIFPHENIVFYTGLFGKKKKKKFYFSLSKSQPITIMPKKMPQGHLSVAPDSFLFLFLSPT